MKPKNKRLLIVSGGMAFLAGAVALALVALSDSIVYFYTPSQLQAKGIKPGEYFRLGGFVKEKSVAKLPDGKGVEFTVIDRDESVRVRFIGILPDLFREGQGVVAEGRLDTAGLFTADRVLAKHDEKYMPRELADELKKQGIWHRPGGGYGNGKK